jgi:hypothetical protein
MTKPAPSPKEILQWLVKEIYPQRIPGRLQIELTHKMEALERSRVMPSEDEEQLKESLRIAVEALKFYADQEHWTYQKDHFDMLDVIVQDEEDFNEAWIGGAIARKALEKIMEFEK